MVKENMTVKKSRYISVRIGGEEIYTENISVSGSIRDHLPAAKIRLREIERIMPLGKWSIRIEQQWPDKDARHFQWIDVAIGKLEEQVMM
jgi:hypothetical protein